MLYCGTCRQVAQSRGWGECCIDPAGHACKQAIACAAMSQLQVQWREGVLGACDSQGLLCFVYSSMQCFLLGAPLGVQHAGHTRKPFNVNLVCAGGAPVLLATKNCCLNFS